MVETEDYIIASDEKTVVITDADFNGSRKSAVVVHFNEPGKGIVIAGAGDPRFRASAPVIKDPLILQPSADVAYWGTDNLFPQNTLEKIEKSTVIGPALNFKTRALYGGGLIYGRETIDAATGEEKFIRAKIPEIDAFFRRSNINRYILESTQDFYYFYNAFPELLLTADRKKVAAISAQEACFTRWSLQNQNTGLTDWAMISGQWRSDPRGANAKFVKAINPYWNAVEDVKADNRFKYIYPISYPTPGKVQYQLAHWNAMFDSNWYENTQLIPEYKSYFMQNQSTIKYHIRINVKYWEWKYEGEWANFDLATKKAKRKEEIQNIEAVLKGAKNAGKTISSPYWCDADGKEHYYWDIIAVDDKIKNGTYIEDSQEATSHLMFALETDPTLIGFSPGSKMNNGGGSEKMIAFNIYLSLCEAHRDCILEPLYFIRDYNGWGDDIVFKLKNNIVNTVDAGVQMKDMTNTNNKANANDSSKNNN